MDRFESLAVRAELKLQGVPHHVVPLDIGDYALDSGVIVERKEVRDLHLSIASRRLWHQLGRLRSAATRPFLLVEGGDLYAGPIHPRAIRGACLAVMGLGVPLIRASDPRDSAAWLAALVRSTARPSRDRAFFGGRAPTPISHPGELVLTAIPGVSSVLARRLIARYGTVAELIRDPAGWTSVEGIGPARARSLRRAFLDSTRVEN